MLPVQFTVSRVLCVLFQRSIPLYSPVPVPLEPPNLPLSQIGIPYSSGSAVRVCYVCMYETNNNKTIYTIDIFFGFAFWKLKVRTKLGDTKGGVEKCFQSRVKSQLSTTVHSLPGGTPTHPLLWTSLASQTPRTYGTLSSPRGGRLGFHEAQTICQTLILWKKRLTMDDWGSDVSPNCFIVRKISRRADPNCFIPGVVPVGFVLMSDPGAINCFTICQELQPGCSFAQIEHLSVIKRWKARFDCSLPCNSVS